MVSSMGGGKPRRETFVNGMPHVTLANDKINLAVLASFCSTLLSVSGDWRDSVCARLPDCLCARSVCQGWLWPHHWVPQEIRQVWRLWRQWLHVQKSHGLPQPIQVRKTPGSFQANPRIAKEEDWCAVKECTGVYWSPYLVCCWSWI